ncbi:nucleotidyltransferase family protein [Microvirga subterranea]|uniref:Molybdenum cofactor cytidylyltransferase n=1 Tax=Microvirga subterranea TaxID=186651 RepID=A0A370HU00_9HYPH|nr:nucleotidyltransferase family protein [Microvirga subterranea]RDI61770.1 molybdenum cofactor cytidylyltransferase [Microvirga subterranea]
MAEFHALVLAAGAGTRFGGRKLLAPWGGGVLLHGALQVALSAPVAGVVLVTGADSKEVSEAAQDFAATWTNAPDVHVIHAQDHRDGLSASLRAGLAALPPSASGAFIFLGDMLCIPSTVPAALADAMTLPNILAAAPVYEGRRGHPVLVSAFLFPQLAALHGDQGARRVLDGLGPALALVPTYDPGVLLDVDETADLARILSAR